MASRRAVAVIGPAEDSGFYLLGLRRCPDGLLASIPWSTAEPHARTLARLQEHGLRPIESEPWFEVDRPEDLGHLRAMLDRHAIDAPVLEALPGRVYG